MSINKAPKSINCTYIGLFGALGLCQCDYSYSDSCVASFFSIALFIYPIVPKNGPSVCVFVIQGHVCVPGPERHLDGFDTRLCIVHL